MKKIIKSILFLSMITQVATAADNLSFVIKPYLQWADQQQIHVRWESNLPSQAWVEYGKATFDVKKPNLSLSTNKQGAVGTFHDVVVNGLEAETAYFYRVACVANGDTIYSAVAPFKTAVKEQSAFAFAVFSDTQGRPNPTVWEKVAIVAERERPNFAIHCGDEVDNGNDQSNWVGQFFPQGQSFMSKYAMYTVPGNHEGDAPNYHRYLGHPSADRVRVYSFVYGNTQFFMVDSNQDLAEGTPLYKKLESELARSTAKWKIVAHHHPIYSSDEDDYGNTNRELSTLGEVQLAHLAGLYEKYSVDIVFYGHIHTYERTWPLKGKTIDHMKGTHYITVGGGGGGLERPAPLRSWFTNKLYVGHHVGFVRVAGDRLQFQALDTDGHVIDQLDLSK